MNAERTTEAPPGDDLSALSWVHDELRRTLEAAHKALRRHLRESDSTLGSDVDAVDPAVLHQARTQLHQAVGVLELVGLPAASALARACEGAVQRWVARPEMADLHAVETIERASFALLDYIGRLLAGKPVAPLALFPQYRAVQDLAGADRVHPADLWVEALPDARVPPDEGAEPRVADEAFRGAVEAQMLALLRHPRGPAAAQMSDLFAGLGRTAGDPAQATLWGLAAAFFEGQAHALLPANVYTKRMAPRLLARLRLAERAPAAGDAGSVSQRLQRDLLFFCAQAGTAGDGAATPRLAAARRAFGLAGHDGVDYEAAQLGRFDPAWVVQARKRVAAAKDSWSAVAGGELHRLSSLGEQFALVGDSLRRLYAEGDALAVALQQAVADTVARGAAPAPEVAMEVATGMLYLDASLEDGDFDAPVQATRVGKLAQRIGAVAQGAAPQPLEGWMEDLYRRVSDRQTMGSVVHELRASLAEAEKAIDQYFRDAGRRDALVPVGGQLQTLRGVLSVLGLDQASQALQRMCEDVDLLTALPQPDQPAVDRLTANLGALGFLVDMLAVQPPLAKSLFHFDPVLGMLRSRVIAEPAGTLGHAAAAPAALIDQAQSLAQAAVKPEIDDDDVAQALERLSHEALVADQGALAQAAQRGRSALERASTEEARQSAREDIAHAMASLTAPAPLAAEAPAPAPAATTGLEDDDEMRDVFLEEAREVLAQAAAALDELALAPEDLALLTTVRRAFHTLKGSSRMVGLNDFGDAAFACEQLYNARLADAPRADEALVAFSRDALAYLGDWVEAVAARRDGGHAAAPVRAAADSLRLDGHRAALAVPGAAAAVEAAGEIAAPAALAAAVDDVAAGPASRADEAAAAGDALEPLAVVEAFELSDADLPDIGLLDLPHEALRPAAADPDAVAQGGSDAGGDAVGDAAADGAAAPAGEVREVEFEIDLGALDDAAAAADATLPTPLDTTPMPFEAATEILEPPPGGEAVPSSAGPALIEPIALDLPDDDTVPPQAADDAEQYKAIGPLRVGIALFNIYLNEADELSRRLGTELAEWQHEPQRAIADSTVALAHSLAGSSATVGYHDLSHLSRTLEHALARSQAVGRGDADEAQLFVDTAEEIRRLLHQFAAGFLTAAPAKLLERLAAHERQCAEREQAATRPPAEGADVHACGETDAQTFDGVPFDADTIESFALDVVDTGVETVEGAAAETAAPEVATERPAEPAIETPAADAGPSAFGTLAAAAWRPLGAAPSIDADAAPVSAQALDGEDDIDVEDAVDAELFPIFEDEAQELLPQLAARMRDWVRRPDSAGAAACMRTLHTLKGGARLAGAMRLGEMAHRLETAIEHLVARGEFGVADVERLQARVDTLETVFEALRGGPAAPPAAEEDTPLRTTAGPDAGVLPVEAPAAGDAAPLDWSRFAAATAGPARAGAAAPSASAGAVRVRVPLLDRLVNHAGEVSITRSRIEADVEQLKSSLADLTDNLERLRHQLRDLELQAETQISSRMEAAKAASEAFDPLELDRFTRFQELTRMMAESVNDVATVQRSLQRTLQSTEDELAAQARLTRDLQDDLLRTRMVEFEGLSDRLYRVVRQAAKETGKQVRLDIVGGSIEVDRGVLDRMTPAFEHLLRNCVTHGVEDPVTRLAAGKPAAGQITVALTQEGNEVGVEFRDDGAGLNLARIRERGVATGLLAADAEVADADLAQLIFAPGFSTAEQVTELAGRGVGMDVVRSDVVAMGGRIETATAAGQGTSFKLVLPLTTAVTQVVMLRCGTTTVAVPSTLVENVRRVPADVIEGAHATGALAVGDDVLPFHWLGALLDAGPRGRDSGGRAGFVVVVRSAQQRVALHVDEIVGNQEVVVKNLGPQLARLPGLAGVTLLASGMPALIYNPVALAALYGEQARARAAAPVAVADEPAASRDERAPLLLVVDDSLTVRRVTQRLLLREGYRVALAKDGLDALERLAEETPTVVLSDIEMPRMDGFDLVRNLRGDARWRDLPVIMITSRIAQKHRDVAAELGVDHYLGKPYSEEDLLALVARYAAAPLAA